MNIVDFMNKFQKVEIDNNFYDIRDSQDLFYWDIVRHDIFYLIYYELTGMQIAVTEQAPSSKITILKRVFANIVGLIFFSIKSRITNYKYVIFTASRDKNDLGIANDHITEDILNEIHEDSFIIETFRGSNVNTENQSVFNYGLTFENYKSLFLKKFMKKRTQESYSISPVLNDCFNTCINFDKEIFKILSNHAITYSYYKKLFKRVNPKAIFLVQNGILKALFSAANSLNLPTIEIQHGFIGYVHPAYSYPISIKNEVQQTLPKFFFTFSGFWASKINYPVQKILPMGNNYYARKNDQTIIKYALTFILANVYTVDLLMVINELLELGFKGQICIKLHPNQIGELETIKGVYKENKNIHVKTNEQSMKDILACSNAVVAIQSTSVYEALHNGLKVFIIKKTDYLSNQDVFDNPNVYLIENNAQIIAYINNKFIVSEQHNMFEEFKVNSFHTFLKKL